MHDRLHGKPAALAVERYSYEISGRSREPTKRVLRDQPGLSPQHQVLRKRLLARCVVEGHCQFDPESFSVGL